MGEFLSEIEGKFRIPLDVDTLQIEAGLTELLKEHGWARGHSVQWSPMERGLVYYDTPELDVFFAGQTVRRIEKKTPLDDRHKCRFGYDYKMGSLDERLETERAWYDTELSTGKLRSKVPEIMRESWTDYDGPLRATLAGSGNHKQTVVKKKVSGELFKLEAKFDLLKMRNVLDGHTSEQIVTYKEMEIEIKDGPHSQDAMREELSGLKKAVCGAFGGLGLTQVLIPKYQVLLPQFDDYSLRLQPSVQTHHRRRTNCALPAVQR